MRTTPFCRRVGTAHYDLHSQNTAAERVLVTRLYSIHAIMTNCNLKQKQRYQNKLGYRMWEYSF